jgi:hypothetical protein
MITGSLSSTAKIITFLGVEDEDVIDVLRVLGVLDEDDDVDSLQ